MKLNLSKIKELAVMRGISLVELATKSGLTNAGLHYIIKSNSSKPATLKKVIEALNVSIEELMDDTEDSAESLGNIKERLKLLQKKSMKSQKDFSKEIGISESRLSWIYSKDSNPGMDLFVKIAKAFPSLNLRWLIAGQGDLVQKGCPDCENMKRDKANMQDLISRLKKELHECEELLHKKQKRGRA